MKTTRANTHIQDQHELAASVLKQAQYDLRRFYAAPSAIERELYLDAYRWVMSDDSSWPFSFLNICESLNLVPEDVRQDLVGPLAEGTVRRWIKHYRRSIQKFRTLFDNISVFRRTTKTAKRTTLVQTSH